jgi:hypothetical protein
MAQTILQRMLSCKEFKGTQVLIASFSELVLNNIVKESRAKNVCTAKIRLVQMISGGYLATRLYGLLLRKSMLAFAAACLLMHTSLAMVHRIDIIIRII